MRARIVIALLITLIASSCQDESPSGVSDTHPPNAVSDLEILAVTDSSVDLGWTVPKDEGAAGRATVFDLRFSTEPIVTEGQFLAATTAAETAVSSQPTVTAKANGLPEKTDLYFSVRAGNAAGAWSGLSNLVSATTLPGVFGVDITLRSIDGVLVPGVEVRLHVPIPAWDDGTIFLGKRAQNIIRFDAPDSALVTVAVRDLSDNLVAFLVQARVVAPGRGSLVYNGSNTDGSHILGTQVLKFDFLATSLNSAQILHEAEYYAAAYLSPNRDLAARLGTTDTNGELHVSNMDLFLGLVSLPEMRARDEAGIEHGTFSFSNDVVFNFINSATGESMDFTHTIELGHNEVLARWNPSPLTGTAGEDPLRGDERRVENAIAGRVLGAVGPSANAGWVVYPPYPNPFN
jgi:hypothetical protein